MSNNPFDTKPEDILHAGLRALVSAVPVLGGPALEFFSLAVIQPSQERRDDFLVALFDRVKELEGSFEALNPENLKENQAFQASCIQAVGVALRTSDQLKIEALRNAVLNSAVAIDLDETTRHLFMSLVDRLAPLHLVLLKLFDNPLADSAVVVRLQNIISGGLSLVIEAAVPSLATNQDLANLLCTELESLGLTLGTAKHVTMTSQGLGDRRTTPMGQSFLKFISDPQHR